MKVRLLLAAAALWATPLLRAVPVINIVNQVSEASYTGYLNSSLYTHAGNDRGWSADHDAARANIQALFTNFGLATTLDPFLYGGGTFYNVVGVLPGTAQPQDVIIVGAHFDSMSNPGADDNASGVAGVLEAARVLSGYSFSRTLVFVAFDREEQGLVGSTHFAGTYAAEHPAGHIQGMVSLDMIAYEPDGTPDARIYATAPNSTTDRLAQAVAAYGNGITTTFAWTAAGSDHYPFEVAGYPAALLAEQDVNPNYHTALDSVDTVNYINYTFATNMTRAAVGFLAQQATETPEPGTVGCALAGLAILVLCWNRGRYT